MANVNIKFNGKEFLLSCEDGQEEHLEELATYLNEKFSDLKSSLGNIGESKLLLITSISVLDEYYETKKKIDLQRKEIKNITGKFKELKSLVYDYKKLKEKEILLLSENLDNLRDEIQLNKSNYEALVDKTTLEIENFIKRNDPDTKIQQ
ncbi:cell division protein ZapA [Candidatus Pelagibacter sp.]|nr:cell division protein ZapA [Candidatus Pelagibacter sp.]